MAAGTIKTTTPHTEKWTGFIDVVFGAIVALGIEKYGDFFPQAWHGGVGVFLLSLLVSIAVCSFVVYDIAVYHDLTIQYPYRSTFRGFVRFYL
ncbi:MAG: hypothetical protein K0S36_2099, partial [Nitrosospira multiformis]|nr:hypothetical protein [Nitrosospira multiformis]